MTVPAPLKTLRGRPEEIPSEAQGGLASGQGPGPRLRGEASRRPPRPNCRLPRVTHVHPLLPVAMAIKTGKSNTFLHYISCWTLIFSPAGFFLI